MNPLERELATMRGFAACRGDDDCLDEADAELVQLRKIEEAAELACGLLWMVDYRIPFVAGACMSVVSLGAVQLIRTR